MRGLRTRIEDRVGMGVIGVTTDRGGIGGEGVGVGARIVIKRGEKNTKRSFGMRSFRIGIGIAKFLMVMDVEDLPIGMITSKQISMD